MKTAKKFFKKIQGAAKGPPPVSGPSMFSGAAPKPTVVWAQIRARS
jgi:hypothetical protein